MLLKKYPIFKTNYAEYETISSVFAGPGHYF